MRLSYVSSDLASNNRRSAGNKSRAGELTLLLLCGCLGRRNLLCGQTLASSNKPRVLLLFENRRDD